MHEIQDPTMFLISLKISLVSYFIIKENVLRKLRKETEKKVVEEEERGRR